MSVSTRSRLCSVFLLIVTFATLIHAAETDPSSPDSKRQPLPEIADEPKMIDPATVMPAQLAVSVTVDFSDSSLREVLEWLNDEQNIVTLLDNNALAEIGVSPSEPVSDRLDDMPIYLLLNRFRLLDIAWYFEDNILHITSSKVAEDRETTLPFRRWRPARRGIRHGCPRRGHRGHNRAGELGVGWWRGRAKRAGRRHVHPPD